MCAHARALAGGKERLRSASCFIVSYEHVLRKQSKNRFVIFVSRIVRGTKTRVCGC